MTTLQLDTIVHAMAKYQIITVCAMLIGSSTAPRPRVTAQGDNCKHIESAMKNPFLDWGRTAVTFLERSNNPALESITFHVLSYDGLEPMQNIETPVDFTKVRAEFKKETNQIAFKENNEYVRDSMEDVINKIELIDQIRIIVHGWTDRINSLHFINGFGMLNKIEDRKHGAIDTFFLQNGQLWWPVNGDIMKMSKAIVSMYSSLTIPSMR